MSSLKVIDRLPYSVQNNPREHELSKKKDKLTLTVEEAGRKVGLGRSAAYGAVRRGEIPVVRIGRKLFVPEKALEMWLAEARPKGVVEG
jgi:excisionase family DNA binding protein